MPFFRCLPALPLWTALLLAVGGGARDAAADNFVWRGLYGSATVFQSGPLATTLSAAAQVPGDDGSISLSYLDAPAVPATALIEANGGGTVFTSRTELSLGEAQIGGLYQAGGIDLSRVGPGGSGTGEIRLRLLLELPAPATIELSSIRSALSATGSGTSAFSLELFPSNSAGDKTGAALLAVTGVSPDLTRTWDARDSYYLLEVNLAATAAPDGLASAGFSFFFDLQPAAIPEPGAVSLLVLGLLTGVLFSRGFHRFRPKYRPF